MTEVAIETRGLTKDYGGGHGLFELDLTVERGEVFGYLGPNGAGKSTTIKLLMGLIHPTAGSATVFGLDCTRESVAVKRKVGYLPGELAEFGGMRGGQVLTFLGGLRGGVDEAHVRELATRLDLDLTRRYREYSRGNKQKLGLVAALMARPPLLILDEPTGGLDPLVQQEFYRIVREERDAGGSVFMSLRVFADVEHTCDHVGIIRAGRLVSVSGLQEIRQMRVHQLTVDFDGTLDATRLENIEGISQVRLEPGHLECHVQGSWNTLLQALNQVTVKNLVSQEPSLEEVFLAYYSGDGTAPAGGDAGAGATPAAAREA